MKAQKVTVTIMVEVLSIDVVPSMVGQALNSIQDEFLSGSLSAEDGDLVTWNTTFKKVEF